MSALSFYVQNVKSFNNFISYWLSLLFARIKIDTFGDDDGVA